MEGKGPTLCTTHIYCTSTESYNWSSAILPCTSARLLKRKGTFLSLSLFSFFLSLFHSFFVCLLVFLCFLSFVLLEINNKFLSFCPNLYQPLVFSLSLALSLSLSPSLSLSLTFFFIVKLLRRVFYFLFFLFFISFFDAYLNFFLLLSLSFFLSYLLYFFPFSFSTSIFPLTLWCRIIFLCFYLSFLHNLYLSFFDSILIFLFLAQCLFSLSLFGTFLYFYLSLSVSISYNDFIFSLYLSMSIFPLSLSCIWQSENRLACHFESKN